MLAVGLTNTTHFLRPLTAGLVTVTAVALNQGRTQSCGKWTSPTATAASSPTESCDCRTSTYTP